MAILQSRQRLLTMNITDDIACQECGKFFSDESGFKRHFRQYHKQYEKDCHICDKKFYTRFMLKNHIGKIHSTVNCDICDKIVVKSALSNHTQTHQERTFQCETCDNVYTRKDSLAKHMKTCGANIVRVRKEVAEAFRCDTCGKTFTKNAFF